MFKTVMLYNYTNNHCANITKNLGSLPILSTGCELNKKLIVPKIRMGNLFYWTLSNRSGMLLRDQLAMRIR